MLAITPSQTIGPFFAFSLTSDEPGNDYPWKQIATNNIFPSDEDGERIIIKGRAMGSEGSPCTAMLIECWQADAGGCYARPPTDNANIRSAFNGFGRVETDEDGGFSIDTIMPGCVATPDGALQAPHINVALFTPGLLVHLWTRIYFEGHPQNKQDPVLSLTPVDRRETLIARRDSDGYTIDFVLRGERETVFFEF